MKSTSRNYGSALPSYEYTDKSGKANLPMKSSELQSIEGKVKIVTGAKPNRKKRRQAANSKRARI